MIDVLLLYPKESDFDRIDDPFLRQSVIAGLGAPLFRATRELEQYLGRSVTFSPGTADHPIFDGRRIEAPAQRSLGAVVLATHLEREGLTWEAIDPGPRDLGTWRRLLRARVNQPRCVALSTTFILSDFWLEAMCAVVRRTMPGAKLLVGGYFYATNVRKFLSIDADVCCVGEGEVRLPQMVKAVRDGRPLDDIPGLYIRRPDGTTLHTGTAEPLDLDRLALPDWELAPRIEPTIDLEVDPLEYYVETQRGCVFKCEFCTYRTLAELSMMSPERAVEAILSVQRRPRGFVSVLDATATFPRERWRQILALLAARGGSRYQLWAYARVSDIDDEIAASMRAANVRLLLIGQESGDQRMLDAMRKGTRASHVLPAMARLQRHGIYAFMSFIVGFPGEDQRSIAATRAMIARLNEHAPDRPAAPFYNLTPFTVQELSTAGQRDELRDLTHYYGYQANEFPVGRVMDVLMETLLQMSRIPHAPVYARFLHAVPRGNGAALPVDEGMRQLFHWLKAVERGIAIFLERDLEGTRPNQVELERIRDRIVARLPAPKPLEVARVRIQARALSIVLGRLQRECSAEASRGAGLLTRLLVARGAYVATGSATAAWRSWKAGSLIDPLLQPGPDRPEITDQIRGMASELTGRSIEKARVVKLRTGTRRAERPDAPPRHSSSLSTSTSEPTRPPGPYQPRFEKVE